MILIQLLFSAINVLMAYYHTYLIAKNKTINHFLWGAVYVGVAALATLVVSGNWFLFISLLALRKFTFDISFNKFMNLPALHLSDTTSSLLDKLNNWIFFHNAKIMYGFYVLAWIVLLFFI